MVLKKAFPLLLISQQSSLVADLLEHANTQVFTRIVWLIVGDFDENLKKETKALLQKLTIDDTIHIDQTKMTVEVWNSSRLISNYSFALCIQILSITEDKLCAVFYTTQSKAKRVCISFTCLAAVLSEVHYPSSEIILQDILRLQNPIISAKPEIVLRNRFAFFVLGILATAGTLMMQITKRTYSYQRGSWRPGSKHQKHMSLNPTLYLYRFPGPRGPGPYTMKYWWTLGCFPTGLSIPFRLQEFLSTYQQHHVPVEVEEWLQFAVKDPVVALTNCIDDLMESLEEFSSPEKGKEYKIEHTSGKSLASPLKIFEEQLGVHVSPAAARATMSFKDLRARILDDLEDYRTIIHETGSTPHRRVARFYLDNHKTLPDEKRETFSMIPSPSVGCSEPSLPQCLAKSIGTIADPQPETAPDERKMIQLLTTFAEGCVRTGLIEEAGSTLYSAIPFAHDSETHFVVHSNVAVCATAAGDYQQAEYHSKEAVLVADPLKESSVKRSYFLWAGSVAFQDDFPRARSIIDDALSLFPDDEELHSWRDELSCRVNQLDSKLCSMAVGEKWRQCSTPAFRSKRLPLATGLHFDNEFCWAIFKKRLYPSKMNPSSNEMGSVFRRVGDMGSFISTSRSSECYSFTSAIHIFVLMTFSNSFPSYYYLLILL
eukprot:gene8531-5978_t